MPPDRLPDLIAPTTPPAADPDAVTRNLARHAEISADSYAANTKRALEGDTRLFQAWCAGHGRVSLPAEPRTVGDFVAAMAAGEAVEVESCDRHGRPRAVTLGGVRRPATIGRYLASIAHLHRAAGLPFDRAHPEITQRLRGVRRRLGVRQRQARGLCWDEILRMLPSDLPDRPPYEPLWERLRSDERGALKAAARLTWLSALRDRALLLLGFASALRRSELVGLDAGPGQTPGDPAGYGWIEFCDEGIRIRLVRSKTDQQGEGRSIGVPFGVHPDTCPVAAVRAWLDHAGIVHGPLFRPISRAGTIRLDRLTDRSVALIVKRAAEAAGLESATYAGHSLRSGHATTVAMNDGDERTIQAQLGHASAEMTRRYIREANIFRRSSAGKLGL